MKAEPSPRGESLRSVASLRRLLLIASLIALYPAFVIGATYVQFFRAELPGGRNGPADAYRHSLASAIVAYTASPRVVDVVTHVMERDGQGSASRLMDAHNNRLGSQIGAGARSWNAMQSAVRDAVKHGSVDAPRPDQITWLPPARWQNRMY